jgi:transcriptional regulator with XRE-family HTH domain
MGITIRAAAEEAGVSHNTYSLWERGLRTPHPDHHRAYHSQLSGWQKAINQVT